MDKNLFNKYTNTINKISKAKQDIIDLIKKETGIDLKPEDVVLDNKNITLNISSLKKMILFKNKTKEKLAENGYKLV